MSIQLFNFCTYRDYLEQLSEGGYSLTDYISSVKVDGIEHMIYQKEPPSPVFRAESYGAHLAYWPYWMALWERDEERLTREFTTVEEQERFYFGARDREEWLSVIRQNMAAAEITEPQYMVWHVAESDLMEAYTFHFRYSDRDVLTATAEVFNSVCEAIPEKITVLFENLWWPGLRLTDPALVQYFFERLKHRNVGIMLDTGHLMNTNPELENERQAADFVCRTVENLGDLARLIKGVHLSCSLSGKYQKHFPRIFRAETTFWDCYRHITSIDQHNPFQTKAARRILDYVRPDYVTHELIYNTLSELKEKLTIQLDNCF